MKRSYIQLCALSFASSVALGSLGACAPKPATQAAPKVPASVPETSTQNPLLVPSTLAYGAPHYDKIKTEHLLPALEQGMKEQREEISKIVDNKAPPTFDNTLLALEQSGATLMRAQAVMSSLLSTMSDEALQKVESQAMAMLSQHSDAVHLDPKLFERVSAVHDAMHRAYPDGKATGEDAQKLRLTDQVYKGFVRAGAKLSAQEQAKVRELNGQISKLQTSYSQNLLASYDSTAIEVKDKAMLEGLLPDEIAALEAAAKSAGQAAGTYRITLLNTTQHPLLAKLKNRQLREQIWKASTQRAGTNQELLRKLVGLRAQKAKLLGFPTWAAYVLDAQMAKTPAAVFAMLTDLAPQSMNKTKQEADEIAKEAKASGQKEPLAPWDWLYFAEKVRKRKYNFDAAQLRPYLELDRVLKDGLFYAMNQQFGVTFKERQDLPTYHPDVRTFEVFDDKGQSIGLFYADYFARKGKRGGAWMMEIVPQNGLTGEKPVVVNCANFPKPAKGEPALISFDNVVTMFHEMGHGVHGLLSASKYPSLAGTNVPRDYVEFPSQYQEDWALDPSVLANYAKHYKTGEPMPPELLAKMKKAAAFNKGFEALEYLKSALLDLAWHDLASDQDIAKVEDFEQATFKKYGVDQPLVPPRYKSPYFSHVFAGGYSAGYYSYIWTEVLAADAFAYVQTQGGLSRKNGDRLRELVLSRGDTLDPMQQYLQFRGQKPKVDALLKRRGLSSP